MRAKLKLLFRLAVATDAEAVQGRDGTWTTRCLHCRTRLQVAADGEANKPSSDTPFAVNVDIVSKKSNESN